MGREGWESKSGGAQGGVEPEGCRRVGGLEGGRPKIFAFFTFPAPFSIFFALGSLLVELWPPVAGMDHPNCAFGLPSAILQGEVENKKMKKKQGAQRCTPPRRLQRLIIFFLKKKK